MEKHSLTFDDKINILILDVDSSKVCCMRPNGVQENACFVIDQSQLKNAWLVTDVGSFQNLEPVREVFALRMGK